MFKNNHRNRNNLDTRPIFIEYLKYVENSDDIVVYQLGKHFRMASNSEEPLAGHDIERVFLVIESNILAEPNDLEIEFEATVSKMKDINLESCFMPKFQKSI